MRQEQKGTRERGGRRETEHPKKEDRDTCPKLSGMETQILLTSGGHNNKKASHLLIA